MKNHTRTIGVIAILLLTAIAVVGGLFTASDIGDRPAAHAAEPPANTTVGAPPGGEAATKSPAPAGPAIRPAFRQSRAAPVSVGKH